jgi:nitric oxide dioxygenase
MLSATTIETVKATAPAVAAHAEEITRRFYQLMFAGDPQVKAFFNQAHQHSGGQQRALAGAICAYAANIDNLGVLGNAVEVIAQKHGSLLVKPEHYPIVGKHLLVAIKQILGDAATDEVIAAWGEAYGLLAQILIDRERAIYAEQAAAPGGWNGRRPFVVDRKVVESDIVTSFYLKPQDGGPLAPFKPGQYITMHIDHPTTPTSPRNYSLSDRPGLDYYRISVKREPGDPPGLISNYLHEQVDEGDVLQLGPPCGEFTLDVDAVRKPIVLISGGVGLTPMLSMLKTLVHRGVDAPIHFIHGTRNSSTHALAGEVDELAAAHPNVHVHVRYSDPLPTDDTRTHGAGIIDVALLARVLPDSDAEYYLCGPKPFMVCVHEGLRRQGVPEAQIHFEFFGPKQDLVISTTEAAADAQAV